MMRGFVGSGRCGRDGLVGVGGLLGVRRLIV